MIEAYLKFHFDTVISFSIILFSGYVQELKEILFTKPMDEMHIIYQNVREKVPASLTSHFEDRMEKCDAVASKKSRDEMKRNIMFPSFQNQAKMQQELAEKRPEKEPRKQTSRKAPACKNCNKPRLGHPKNSCPL